MPRQAGRCNVFLPERPRQRRRKPEDQQRIFREFEQLESAYVREQQGTGLGLALSKKLARR